MPGREDFEERRQARIDHLSETSRRAFEESKTTFQHSHDLVKDIPLGRPNIIGRSALPNLREKSLNALGRSVKLDEKGAHYADRAEAAESNTAIFSDDPSAIDKLHEKIARLEAEREKIKAANKAARKNGTEPAPWYVLPYIGRDIKAAKDRIAKLELVDSMLALTASFAGGEIESDPDTNRVIIHFDVKPGDEVISELKRNGFKWAPSVPGWQRLRSPYSLRLAYRICGVPGNGENADTSGRT